jgi:hypothetical protein
MILFLSETKIDASFPDAQFSIDNFTMWRADRNKFGGGVMVYIRSHLAADRKIQYEFREIESIGVEVTSGNEKWFVGVVYKPPSTCMSDEHFYTDFGQTVDKIISKYIYIYLLVILTMICLTMKRVQWYEISVIFLT